DGAIVAVTNEATNEARALLLLEAQGLIEVDDNAGITATVVDITSNPLNLQFEEIEAAQTARALQDVDIAALNGNYALEAGLSVEDAIALEASDSLAAQTYANIIAVHQDNVDSEKTQALVNAILSDEVRDYINENYAPAVQPVF
ncbi:MAG: MetQ/NlpA family ABC transporter substrate-binding protein, partial [Lachnospiraceae bacterium]